MSRSASCVLHACHSSTTKVDKCTLEVRVSVTYEGLSGTSNGGASSSNAKHCINALGSLSHFRFLSSTVASGEQSPVVVKLLVLELIGKRHGPTSSRKWRAREKTGAKVATTRKYPSVPLSSSSGLKFKNYVDIITLTLIQC